MINHVLLRSTRSLRISVFDPHRHYHVGKAASVNTAIERALRNSTPFTARRASRKDQASEAWPAPFAGRSRESASTQRRNGPSAKVGSLPHSSHSIRDRQQTEETTFVRSSKFGDRSHITQETRSGQPSRSRNSSTRKVQEPHFSRSSNIRGRSNSASRGYPSLSPREKPFEHRSSEGNSSSFRHQPFSGTHKTRTLDAEPSSVSSSRDEAVSPRLRDTSNGRSDRPLSSMENQFLRKGDHASPDRTRLPLSIPYTTPASEFLYGTSVVEAALRSQRIPRRKLYKLYIYSGENREGGERDNQLERLARMSDVEVVKVGNNWLRLMDKLSSGRPHNGYILEASPLPRLPVSSLGQLTTREGREGYEVIVGYQSREEAAVNGAANFIPLSGRAKPLVLLLDGIVDPGNLGGIIRTASFLGANAIAISTRNSANFSPVVLKASAGASETVTLFSVSTPAGFIVESKLAGWKIFAGVAPSTNNNPGMQRSVSTDELGDPLSESPSILMLGSEGEGLRWNLRSKADVELYIEGCGQSGNVDSLNVNVAAGILCNAFLRKRDNVKAPLEVEDVELKQEKLQSENLF